MLHGRSAAGIQLGARTTEHFILQIPFVGGVYGIGTAVGGRDLANCRMGGKDRLIRAAIGLAEFAAPGLGALAGRLGRLGRMPRPAAGALANAPVAPMAHSAPVARFVDGGSGSTTVYRAMSAAEADAIVRTGGLVASTGFPGKTTPGNWARVGTELDRVRARYEAGKAVYHYDEIVGVVLRDGWEAAVLMDDGWGKSWVFLE